jgi:hypothetical protein
VVPSSGGVRKLRWGLRQHGKRGGVRVIYYWKQSDDEIWMLTIYAKNEASTIPALCAPTAAVVRRIAEELKNG